MVKKILRKFLRTGKKIVKNLYANLLIHRNKKREVKKFKDPRRVAIYSKINLTNEQRKQIDEFYLKNYGKKIPYTWHRHFTAFTGNFDYRYFPELLYIPVFEKFMNYKKGFCQVLSDKNFLTILAKGIGVKMPETIVSKTAGMLRDANNEAITYDVFLSKINNAGDLFVKPSVGTSSGRGCFIINIIDGIDTYSLKSIEEIYRELGEDFVIQERLKCHDSIRKIYPNSVNTFRIITYRWKNEIIHVPITMRIGQGGSHLDNAHAGGMFIALDEDGTMHKTAFTEFKKEFTEHPDTHLVFDGYKIDLLPKVLDCAIKTHMSIPEIGSVHWDFTIDENGEPVLIEANVNGGGIWISEMAHGCGCFGEKTAEVLQWIRQQEKLSVDERIKYPFGKMKENK